MLSTSIDGLDADGMKTPTVFASAARTSGSSHDLCEIGGGDLLLAFRNQHQIHGQFASAAWNAFTAARKAISGPFWLLAPRPIIDVAFAGAVDKPAFERRRRPFGRIEMLDVVHEVDAERRLGARHPASRTRPARRRVGMTLACWKPASSASCRIYSAPYWRFFFSAAMVGSAIQSCSALTVASCRWHGGRDLSPGSGCFRRSRSRAIMKTAAPPSKHRNPHRYIPLIECAARLERFDRASPEGERMRYFLDTEYNGWGGALLSLALVPDDGEELYLTLAWDGALEPWVERNVVPYLDTVPQSHCSPRLNRGDAARTIAHYLAGDPDPLIVADWPEDIAQFNALLVTGPGPMAEVPPLTLPVPSRWPASARRRTARSRTMRCTTRARCATTSSAWNELFRGGAAAN